MSDNSRVSELTFRKEDLARALARLRSVTMRATSELAELRAASKTDRAAIAEMREALEQERKNSSQYERLLASTKEELREASMKVESTSSKRQQSDAQSLELQRQSEALRDELEELELRNATLTEDVRSKEDSLGELRMELNAAHTRIHTISQERDQLKNTLYEQERLSSQWSVQLTAAEKSEAEQLLADLMSRVNELEERLLHTLNGSAS